MSKTIDSFNNISNLYIDRVLNQNAEKYAKLMSDSNFKKVFRRNDVFAAIIKNIIAELKNFDFDTLQNNVNNPVVVRKN